MTLDSGAVWKGDEPRWSGYSFLGWFDGEEEYVSNVTRATKNVTLLARWQEVQEAPKYTVSFDVNGGSPSVIKPATVDSGSTTGRNFPEAPRKANYVFDGWYDGETQYTSETVITKDVTLVAQWREVTATRFTVRFNTNGGTPSSIGSMAVDSGAALGARFPADPTKADVVFRGWFDGETRYNAQTPITKDVTLVAVFEAVVPVNGTFTDSRNNQTYKTVKLINQTWMAENLNYETGNSWCYGNNAANCDTYGRLYDWGSAKTACPTGWHLPTRAEWGTLAVVVGDTGTYGVNGKAGKKLKAKSGWNNRNDGSSGNGTDEYGFSALPGGFYDGAKNSFNAIDNYGRWWTATEYDGSTAYDRYIFYSADYINENTSLKSSGFSVRCLQNN